MVRQCIIVLLLCYLFCCLFITVHLVSYGSLSGPSCVLCPAWALLFSKSQCYIMHISLPSQYLLAWFTTVILCHYNPAFCFHVFQTAFAYPQPIHHIRCCHTFSASASLIDLSSCPFVLSIHPSFRTWHYFLDSYLTYCLSSSPPECVESHRITSRLVSFVAQVAPLAYWPTLTARIVVLLYSFGRSFWALEFSPLHPLTRWLGTMPESYIATFRSSQHNYVPLHIAVCASYSPS